MMKDSVIFCAGPNAQQEFKGNSMVMRGIKRRIRHDVLGISLHDAELIKGIQEGHRHTVLYEAIMLLEGRIEACWWDDLGSSGRRLLSKRGDLAIFPPDRNHTLVVEEDSHIIVVKFSPSTKKDEWKASTLPKGLMGLREQILEAEDRTEKALGQTRQALSKAGNE